VEEEARTCVTQVVNKAFMSILTCCVSYCRRYEEVDVPVMWSRGNYFQFDSIFIYKNNQIEIL